MSTIMFNTIALLVQSVSIFIIMKMISNDRTKCNILKTLFVIIIIMVIMIATYNVEYNLLISIISYSVIAIVYKFFLNISLSKSVVISGFAMLLQFISDIIISSIIVILSTIETVRSDSLFFLITNISVSILAVTIIHIPQIRKRLIKFQSKFSYEYEWDVTIFIILLIIVISVISYNVSTSTSFIGEQILNIVITIIFTVLTTSFLKEKYARDALEARYDQLLEYVEATEDWIDEESLNEHESKNQLATLKDMVSSNKKALEYIDSILYRNTNQTRKIIKEISRIPKGGLKGLLFYKINTATENNIEFTINVSKNIDKYFNKLPIDNIRDLCRIVGIFLDNAIEAASSIKTRKVDLEIYIAKNTLNIVVSNTIDNVFEVDRMGEKGYSTKGTNRGNGLYYAGKLLRRNKNIEVSKKIVNNYFISKIIIREYQK